MSQEATIINTAVSLIPTLAVDSVAVFNQDYVQVFPNARPIKVTINEPSKPMEHPLETGSVITDHRIILPTEIEISLILTSRSYRDTYNSIRQLYTNGDLLIIETWAATYENQFIVSMPHEEDPSMYNTLTVALKFKEAQFVTSSFQQTPRNPNNKKTVERGNIQQQKPASTEETGKARSQLDEWIF